MQQTRCINCMKEIAPGTRFCPECGCDQQTPQAADALRASTVLQGRYIVGRELGRGKAGITYVGRDTVDEVNVAIREYFPSGTASRDGKTSPRVVWSAALNRAETEQRVEQALGLELNSVMEGNALRPTEVRDAFQENGTAYLVADFTAGTRPEAVDSAFAVSAGVMETAEAFQAEEANGVTEAYRGGVDEEATEVEAFQNEDADGTTRPFGGMTGRTTGENAGNTTENSWNPGDNTVAWNGTLPPDMAGSGNNNPGNAVGAVKAGKKKRKKGKAGIIIAIVAVCVLAAAIAVTAFILNRSNTADNSAEPAVTVTDVEISLAGDSISMYAGDSKTISVVTKPTGMDVTWSSSDETVATVSENGTVTAVGVGEADITASTPSGEGTAEAVCSVTVKAPSVSLSAVSLALYTGETAALAATVIPSGTEVTFSSSDESVAVVDGDGNVTALQAGSAIITASVTVHENVYDAACTVTVEKSMAQEAADLAYEAKELAKAAQEKAWLAEDGASEAAEKAQEAAENGETFTYMSATYRGEMNGTSREGYGIYSWEEGNSYQGEWKDDGMEGYAVFYWASGDYYTGQYSDGVRSGYGSLYYTSGSVYSGEWSEGSENGYGILSYSSGDTYAGEFLDDVRNGYGVYTWSSGLVYAGEWIDGTENGYGIVYEDGEVLYAGWWEDGVYQGETGE